VDLAKKPGALFDHLPDPPALILAYLSYALPSSLASPRTATIHLLFQLESTSIPSHTLSSICTAILANPSALDASEPLPSSLPSPDEVSRPDVGPSSPPIPATTWTLSLLLPLLRLCTDKNCPSPITQMVGKVLSIVAPYPAPPFDVGLESSQLMGSLPDSISMPLRESLSGLMTDLAISEVTQAQAPVSASTAIDVPPGNGMDGASPLDGARLSSINPREIYTDSLPNALSMLLAAYRQQPRIDRNDSYSSTPPRPPKGLLDLLKLGWAISSNGEQLLSDLLSVILDQVSGDLSGMEGRNVDAWVLAVEDIPILVRRWKDQPGPKTPFPVCAI
jgi:mediator of RNA polymerase II transcription subunit 5